MNRHFPHVTSLLAISLTCVAVAGAPQAGIDPAASTSALAGVVTEAGSNQPVRHATVSIQISDRPPRTVNTDDAGRFAFGGLAAGRYLMYVRANGYVPTQYGASGPGRSGAAIALGAGQRIDGVNVALVRCASIAGTITVQTNQPLELAVHLARWTYSPLTAQRTFGATGASQGVIDDRGVYRIHDVPPGTYLVIVSELFRNGLRALNEGEVISPTVSHADVQAALLGTSLSRALTSAGGEALRSVVWAPTFFPGTAIAANAEPITVGPGEERTGVDIAVRIVPAATVSGTIVAPPGVTPRETRLQLFPADLEGRFVSFEGMASLTDAWTFSIRGVRPGRYIAAAHALAAGSLWWSQEPVVVDGSDISNLTLALQPGVAVSGRVEFSPPAPAAAVLAQLRIGLTAVAADARISVSSAAAAIDADGRFTIGGVTPGRHRFELKSSGGSPSDSGWWLESAVVDGTNAADVPVEIAGTRVDQTRLIITNRARSQLTGIVRDAAGAPVRDATIVLFTTTRESWPALSRRVRSAEPTAEGAFTMSNVLPGEYFVVALGDVERNQWLDPAFLEGLAAAGPTRVTLREGERASLSLTVK